MNKKGAGRELTFLIAFIVIVLTSVSVVYTVSVFGNKDYGISDVRAEIFANRIKDCIEENKVDFLVNPEAFDLFDKCYLNKTSLEELDYYFAVYIKENNKLVEKSSYGNLIFKERCELIFNSGKEIDNYPFCLRKPDKKEADLKEGELRIIVGIREDNDEKKKTINPEKVGGLLDV